MSTSQYSSHTTLHSEHKSYMSFWIWLCLTFVSLSASAQNAIKIGDEISYEFTNSWSYSAKGDETDYGEQLFKPTGENNLLLPYTSLYESTPDSVYSSFTLTALSSSAYGTVFRLHINQPCYPLDNQYASLDSVIQFITQHDIILAYNSSLDQYIICNSHELYPSFSKLPKSGISYRILDKEHDSFSDILVKNNNTRSFEILKYLINVICPGLKLAIMAQSIPWQDKVTITGHPLDGSSRTMNYCNTTDKVSDENFYRDIKSEEYVSDYMFDYFNGNSEGEIDSIEVDSISDDSIEYEAVCDTAIAEVVDDDTDSVVIDTTEIDNDCDSLTEDFHPLYNKIKIHITPDGFVAEYNITSTIKFGTALWERRIRLRRKNN